MAMLALLENPADHWVHDLKPELFRIPFPKIGEIQDGLPIRYYSLAYLFGLLLAWWLMKRLARARQCALTVDQVADLIIPYALLGVMIGGRLGFLLFYDVDPHTHRYTWIDHPIEIVQIWHGGMASHGGIAGVLGAMWLFARKHKVPLLHVLDLCCLTAPLGLFLGRVANFINGELWGRPSDVAWAVVFPAARDEDAADPQSHAGFSELFDRYGGLPRHPSQIYEALGEGLLLFLLLLALRRSLMPRSGGLTALFLLGYGLARVVCEQFREPDAQIGFTQLVGLQVTRGQVLTTVLIVAGAWLLARVLRGKTPTWQPPPIPDAPAPASARPAARR